MNKRRFCRAVLLLGTVCLLAVGACGLWLRSYRRQEALNRQLIAALVNHDPKLALVLVNAGADPNTPLKPSPPSLKLLWNRLVHRTALPRNDTPSAFLLACGAFIPNVPDARLLGLKTDEPHLVETMLQHGAQKNAKDSQGMTTLLWSVVGKHPKTVDVLLNHGVDVNAQGGDGYTALCWALLDSSAHNLSERSESANLVRKLLAHGADSNLPDWEGTTPLQWADANNRPDLVALLKQAGAKK